jgi:hypothetical protein
MCKAGVLNQEDILTEEEILQGAEQDVLNKSLFIGKTPLWYYILREAQLKGQGNRLGPVGSRIVSETLYGLILESPNSILKAREWRPRFGDRVDEQGQKKFEMVDLLEFADVVNPYPPP